MPRTFVKQCGLVVLAVGLFIAPVGMSCTRDLNALGGLGGNQSIAAAMNAIEQVVGGAETADGRWHAFLWEGGEMTDLGTLGGDNAEAHDLSLTFYLLVVGTSEMPDPNDPNFTVDRAFLWQEDVMTDLGTLGGPASEAWAVSDMAKVVGAAETTDGDWHAFLWEGDVMTDLGTLGGDQSCALGINNAAQVVGWSMAPVLSDDPNDPNLPDPPPVRRAFLWTAAEGMTDLGTLGGRNSSAYAVSEDGYVVGWSDTTNGERHAFLWDAVEGMQDLGTLGGPIAEAWGVGPTGVVGYSLDANDAHQGFWWEVDGPLQSLRRTLRGDGPVFVYDIDGSTQMVGSARTPEGEEHAFLREYPGD